MLSQFLKYGDKEYTHKKLGTERVTEVLAEIGNPHLAYPSVLIAGTNGKGTVGRLLEAILLRAGFPVGLYSSPHLERFNERIRVGGREVSDEECDSALNFFREKQLLSEEGSLIVPSGKNALTWFEKTTVLAFEIFRRRRIPLAILEVGLGARLDATNVASPLVSVITSVSRDHTEVLGESLFEIAREKLAVMRPGRPLILAPMATEVRTFLNKAARLGGAKPINPEEPEGDFNDFHYGPLEHLRVPLRGRHHLKNVATALETIVALKEAGFKIDNNHVREGLAAVENPGRLEWIAGEPPILLDVAHNPEAWEGLRDYLQENYARSNLILLAGMMRDKPGQEFLNLFSSLKSKILLTEFDSPRTAQRSHWENWRKQAEKRVDYEYFSDPRVALARAKELAESKGLIVVTGSFYLVGEIRRWLI